MIIFLPHAQSSSSICSNELIVIKFLYNGIILTKNKQYKTSIVAYLSWDRCKTKEPVRWLCNSIFCSVTAIYTLS